LARALIVGCGCRGRLLGAELLADGWQVRGTSRTAAGREAIEAADIDAAQADPDSAGSVLELVHDVAVVVWALGSATGPAELVAAVNGPRLERVLERLVDTPVRGFVYEGAGSAPGDVLAGGSAAVRDAGRRWRIPVAVVATPPNKHADWAREMAAAARGLLGLGTRG
jgi:nucleoside-diphosphate-sugar epimerase